LTWLHAFEGVRELLDGRTRTHETVERDAVDALEFSIGRGGGCIRNIIVNQYCLDGNLRRKGSSGRTIFVLDFAYQCGRKVVAFMFKHDKHDRRRRMNSYPN
jgi:hypothetical protein